MKLKTLLLFYLKRLSKFFLLICLGSFSAKVLLANDAVGIIESYEKINQLNQEQFVKSEKQIGNNIKILSTISNIKEFQLESNFVQSLLLSSEDKYLALGLNDECKFYSALESNLLKTATGEVKAISITFKDKAGTSQFASIPPADFFSELYKRKCFNNKEFTTLFNLTNVKKTVEGIKFNVPKNKKECELVHHEWQLNSYTPYLCQIYKAIITPNSSSGDFYRQNISPFQKIYIENLCAHLNSSELFCQNYLKEDIWNKVINGEQPSYKLTFKCQSLFSANEKVGKQELAACAAKLTSMPETCETKGIKDFPAIFPLQNCDQISLALLHSKLVTNYHDCPAKVDNSMLTNVHRIINHFDSTKIESTKENCAGEANYSAAKLNFDTKNENAWPLRICFMNRVQNKEECVPYIPGNHPNEPLSEDVVVSKILYLHKGASRKTTCRLVDTKTYNPLLSEFKLGCFIIYNAESCNNLSCNKKVIWDEKEQTDMKFTGRPIFDYYSTNYLSERFSLVSLINEAKGTQSRSIKNLTDLVFYLDKIPGSIIHGIGCAEDLMPEQFYRVSLNACHPLPFIIDGHIEKNNSTLVVFRSAIDDIHTPRLIPWQNIFAGVNAYQLLHPLNTWTLDGLKK